MTAVGEFGEAVAALARRHIARQMRHQLGVRAGCWQRRCRSGNTHTSARHWANRRNRRSARVRFRHLISKASARNLLLMVSLSWVPNQAFTWIELTLAAAPSACEGIGDLLRGGQRQGRHVLAEVDGDIDLAIGLVGGDGRAGKFLQHAARDRSRASRCWRGAPPRSAHRRGSFSSRRRRSGNRRRRSRPPRHRPAIAGR